MRVQNSQIKVTVREFETETPVDELMEQSGDDRANNIEHGSRTAIEARLFLSVSRLISKSRRSRGVLPHSPRQMPRVAQKADWEL